MLVMEPSAAACLDRAMHLGELCSGTRLLSPRRSLVDAAAVHIALDDESWGNGRKQRDGRNAC